MFEFKDYLNQFTNVQNWDFEMYRQLFFRYGPEIIFAILFLIVGKLVLGKIRFLWTESYKKKGISNAWSQFIGRSDHKRFLLPWKEYFSDKTNKTYFILSFIFCAGVFVLSAKFMAYNADVPGKILYDPIMALLPVKDWSVPIFIIEYIAVVLIVFHACETPASFINGFWGATTLQLVRCIFIVVVRLSPPTDIIFLKDPVTQLFFGDNIHVANDLFFSGHVSFLVLFFFFARNKYIRIYLFFASFIVALLLVWQHVHYSYDVLFAPIASYAVYKLVLSKDLSKNIRARYKKYIELNGY